MAEPALPPLGMGPPVGGLPAAPGHLRLHARRELNGQSAIYWHAAGLGNDDAAHPEQTEHFGITTVEAMAAGCVPVVINKAGQRETVEHGVSGFLWDTPDELQRYTARLIED